MITNETYFEIGRGAKLLQKQYWHQFVLGVDLSNKFSPFVLTEVGGEAIIYSKNIDFKTLQSTSYKQFITYSGTKDFVLELKQAAMEGQDMLAFLRKIAQSIQQKAIQLNRKWLSKTEYSGLNYNSNFSNWIDATATKGKLEFVLDLELAEPQNCRLNIPVQFISGDIGYYSILYGRFQLSQNLILIWANEHFPYTIPYRIEDQILRLKLYKKEILFEQA